MTRNEITILLLFTFTFWSCSNDDDSTNINNPIKQGDEKFPGGEGTVIDFSHLAFNQRLRNLSSETRGKFSAGNSIFDRRWVEGPAAAPYNVSDGLGPFLNASSCGACHTKDGRGKRPDYPSTNGGMSMGLLLRLSIPGTDQYGGPLGDPNYGGQLQDQSIENVVAEGTFSIGINTIEGAFDDGESYLLEQPIYQPTNLQLGELSSNILISPRVAPQMIGLGLLEAIDESELLEFADEFDSDQDGISGRPNYVWDKILKKRVLGRFGWKANEPNLRQQNADAFNGDIGITNSINFEENCITGDCIGQPNGANEDGIELSDYSLGLVETYSQTLAPPYRPNWDDPNVLAGKNIFFDLKCNACHVEKHTTGTHKISELSNQVIYPYTDLLLHDMGPLLEDGRPDFEASGSEWRTPPLWGIGRFQIVSGHTQFMHDGRANNLTEAILWHGGEAEQSKTDFKSLNKEDRNLLIEFLNSL